MPNLPKTCAFAICGKRLDYRNTSGLCAAHQHDPHLCQCVKCKAKRRRRTNLPAEERKPVIAAQDWLNRYDARPQSRPVAADPAPVDDNPFLPLTSARIASRAARKPNPYASSGGQ